MKILGIEAQNFIGIKSARLVLNTPIALFAGRNYAGKSSLQEAVRMALTGESVRVTHKKDYGQIVTDGQNAGFASVHFSGGDATMVLASGSHTVNGLLPAALPFVLDAQRFARLPENDRRSFLFGLMGLSTNGAAVKERLTTRGCDAGKVELIMPTLRAGFDAAHKEAKEKAKDSKTLWRALTGETYGSVKALAFRAPKPEVDLQVLESGLATLATIEFDIEAKTNALGGLQEQARRAAGQKDKLAELKETAGRFARIQEKLLKDETELKAWTAKVEETRAKASGEDQSPPLICPHCAGLLDYQTNLAGGELVAHVVKKAVRDPEAVAKLPEYEKALALYVSSVANGKRDLEASNTAAGSLKALEEAGLSPTIDQGEINGLSASIEALKASKKLRQTQISELQDNQRKAVVANDKTDHAMTHHESVVAWDQIADALAPDGIPGELLAKALGPINARITQSAVDAEWPKVGIEPDMQITAGGRIYSLLSESEKWRTDAMIAEAISFISGIKMIFLDRFDMLDTQKGRADLFAWLDILASNGEIETALISGTLPTLPTDLPATFSAYWIEDGVVGLASEAS